MCPIYLPFFDDLNKTTDPNAGEIANWTVETLK
jgi:hypothetical protein